MKSIKLKYVLLICIFLLHTFFGCAHQLEKKQLEIHSKTGKSVLLTVELAKTQEEQQQGFMKRNNIPDGTGMLFIFDKDQHLSFWMKNTPTPLSIAYIDSKGIIKEIHDMTPYSLEAITSEYSVRYALEVPQGWFSKNNIKTGDYIQLSSSKF